MTGQFSFPLLFLSLALAGCATQNQDPQLQPLCPAIHIPPVAGGSTFEYSVEEPGVFSDLAHIATPVDWRAAGSAEGQSEIDLPIGTKLVFVIGDRAEIRLGADGAFVPAFHVSIWVKRPNDPKSIAILDEWIAEDGRLVQSIMRNTYLVDEGKVLQFVRLMRQEHPGLLASQIVWPSIAAGSEWHLEFPEETGLPLAKPGQASVEIRARLEPSGGVCRAILQGSYQESTLSESALAFTMEFEDGNPMPDSYQVSRQPVTGSGSESALVLRLSAQQSGAGRDVPAWNGTRTEGGILRGASQNGFLAETESTFLTPWPDAWDAMEADITVSQWLAAHPNAAIAKVQHGLALEPGKDAWLVDWWSGDGSSGLGVTILRTASLLPMLQDSIQVTSAASGGLEEPVAMVEPISLAALVQAYRMHSNHDPEVLQCNFARSFCGIGTHEGTNFPRHGESGSAFISPGLIVDPATGTLYGVQSIADYDIGPPVQP